MGQAAIDIRTLSPSERLDLLGQLWDSLQPSQIPVTEAQKRELDRRLDDLDHDLAEGRVIGVPWDEVLKQLRSR